MFFRDFFVRSLLLTCGLWSKVLRASNGSFAATIAWESLLLPLPDALAHGIRPALHCYFSSSTFVCISMGALKFLLALKTTSKPTIQTKNASVANIKSFISKRIFQIVQLTQICGGR